MGRTLIFIGLAIAVVGVVLWSFPRAFAWFGQLPGDIRIERDGTRIFIPITSMLVVSVALSVLLSVAARIFDL